jgi:hypothetical protein
MSIFKIKLSESLNLKNDCKAAIEMTRKGIYKVDPNQSKFPIKFMQRLMQQFKTPTNVDNGPPIPPKHF